MFGLFKKVIVQHPVFGPLTRHGREWEGTIEIQPNRTVPLELEGTKEAPHAETIKVALELPGKLPGLIPDIAKELFDHLEPYREAIMDANTGFADSFDDPKAIARIKKISSPDDAWAASEVEGVEVGLENGKPRLLIRIQSIWDEEHRLGAYFDDWQFIGFNGSV